MKPIQISRTGHKQVIQYLLDDLAITGALRLELRYDMNLAALAYQKATVELNHAERQLNQRSPELYQAWKTSQLTKEGD